MKTVSVQNLISRIETARSNLQGAKTQLFSSRAINPANITSLQNPGTTEPCTPEPKPGRGEAILKGALAGAGTGAVVGVGAGVAIGVAPAATGVGAVATPITVPQGIVAGGIIGAGIGAGVGAVGGLLYYEIDAIPDEGCPTLPPTL
ncbi:MAG: hypothetical protein HC840_08255 [Leptolyngbyaceae cyanobacterium RM2_2_4]|nr:hypothetical protein [Leptolyngbyaceae cyanobacterium RM2_2_4]